MGNDFVCKSVTNKKVIKDFLGFENTSTEDYFGIFGREGDFLIGIIGYYEISNRNEIILNWGAPWCNMTEKILSCLFQQFIVNIWPSNLKPVVSVIDDDSEKIIRKLIKKNILPVGTEMWDLREESFS